MCLEPVAGTEHHPESPPLPTALTYHEFRVTFPLRDAHHIVAGQVRVSLSKQSYEIAMFAEFDFIKRFLNNRREDAWLSLRIAVSRTPQDGTYVSAEHGSSVLRSRSHGDNTREGIASSGLPVIRTAILSSGAGLIASPGQLARLVPGGLGLGDLETNPF